jgi:hypothetical protein
MLSLNLLKKVREKITQILHFLTPTIAFSNFLNYISKFLFRVL